MTERLTDNEQKLASEIYGKITRLLSADKYEEHLERGVVVPTHFFETANWERVYKGNLQNYGGKSEIILLRKESKRLKRFSIDPHYFPFRDAYVADRVEISQWTPYDRRKYNCIRLVCARANQPYILNGSLTYIARGYFFENPYKRPKRPTIKEYETFISILDHIKLFNL